MEIKKIKKRQKIKKIKKKNLKKHFLNYILLFIIKFSHLFSMK